MKAFFCASSCVVLMSVVLMACARSPSTSPGTALVATSSESAAAPARCMALTRGDWVLEWSEYVARESTIGGKSCQIYSPAPGARRVLRDTSVTPATVPAQGALRLGMGLEATIFDAAELRVSAGDVLEREVSGDRVASACVTGVHAKVFWTNAHEKTTTQSGKTTHEPFSTIFIEGASVGQGALELTLTDGTVKTITIVVTAASRTPPEPRGRLTR